MLEISQNKYKDATMIIHDMLISKTKNMIILDKFSVIVLCNKEDTKSFTQEKTEENEITVSYLYNSILYNYTLSIDNTQYFRSINLLVYEIQENKNETNVSSCISPCDNTLFIDGTIEEITYPLKTPFVFGCSVCCTSNGTNVDPGKKMSCIWCRKQVLSGSLLVCILKIKEHHIQIDAKHMFGYIHVIYFLK